MVDNSRYLLRAADASDVASILSINHAFFQYSPIDIALEKENDKKRTEWLSDNIGQLCKEDKGFLLSRFTDEDAQVCSVLITVVVVLEN